jgi:magnesium chelatase family protein
LLGVDGTMLEIEAVTKSGQVSGMPDGLTEATQRVRAAVRNSNLSWPDEQVTLPLSPAVSSHEWPSNDLAMACAVLAADQPVSAIRLDRTVLIGELALNGQICPVRGLERRSCSGHAAC